MRIVVNDIAASQGGAMTVLRDFYHFVCEHDAENEWIFLLGDAYFPSQNNVRIETLPKVKRNWLLRLAFDCFWGRRYISAYKPDVLLSLQNTAVRGLRVPQVVYMHQSIPFQDEKRFSFFKRAECKLAVYQHLIGALIKASVRRADAVIVQTEWIRRAVAEKCKVDIGKIFKVLPTVQDLSAYKQDGLFEKESFIYPTSDAIYKNNAVIFAAAAALEAQKDDFTVLLTLPAEKSKGTVRCVGKLPYEELLQLYNRSTLIFPSYIETFGYPLAEARAMGAIILASDCAFSREVLEGYENAYFFSPRDSAALADLMHRVLKGEIMRKASAPFLQQESGWTRFLELLLKYSPSVEER